jgi:hypothetical protein
MESMYTHKDNLSNSMANSCSVGAPRQKRIGSTFTYDDVDGKEDENAFATFRFKYRSLGESHLTTYYHTQIDNHPIDTLKSLGIVPRSPNPTPPATPPRQDPASAPINIPNAGLTCEELIAIIGTYRGHTNGLTDLSDKELIAVLDHYRVRNLSCRPQTIAK